jgi:hypothetical protein
LHQIKLKWLCGIRDKLPKGQFIVVVSMYDRLGGHLLRWSNLRGQEWSGASLASEHDGRFSSQEIAINQVPISLDFVIKLLIKFYLQSVFTVCPPKKQLRPGMVLMFEIYLLRGDVSPVDRVVGWGVFPIADAGLVSVRHLWCFSKSIRRIQCDLWEVQSAVGSRHCSTFLPSSFTT